MENYPTLRKNVIVKGYQVRNLDLNNLYNVIHYPKFGSNIWFELAMHGLKPLSLSQVCEFARIFPCLSILTLYSRNCYAGRGKDANWSVGWVVLVEGTSTMTLWELIESPAELELKFELKTCGDSKPTDPFSLSQIITLFDLERFLSSLLTTSILGS